MAARSASDPVAELIPWYANGTLEEGERKLVEEHLAGCEACRDRLDDVRSFSRGMRSAPASELRDHVDARLLTDYVERPGSLEPETVRFVEARLEACETCREAHARLVEVAQALDAGRARVVEVERRPALERLWTFLASTVLRPAPALAYLLALALLVPVIWLARPGAPPEGIAATPTRVAVEGDRATRAGAPGGTAAAPLEISASASTVLLELETELEPGDLERIQSLTIELRRGDVMLWSAPAPTADVLLRNGRVVVPVVLRPGGLAGRGDHEILLRVSRPGDPLDGQALFRRKLRIVGEER
jgi:anti-sigma factor RsiW